jgi:hypothetical protein
MCRWVKADAKLHGFKRSRKSQKAAAATDDQKQEDANSVEGHSCLSVWRVRSSRDDDDDGNVGAHRYAILGHALLQPYRCIVVQVESIAAVRGRAGAHFKISFTTSPCRRYEHIKFATAFQWVRDCRLGSETETDTVELLRMSWEVTGWQTFVVTGTADAKLVWAKSGRRST